METIVKANWSKCLALIVLLFIQNQAYTQIQNVTVDKSNFWERVQFGGGLGLNFGVFTNVFVAPQAIYNLNDLVAVGVGLQYNYLKERNVSQATMVGASVIGLFNPTPAIQLSTEIEQLRVNQTLLFTIPNQKESFWNTALFVGAGYRVGNVSIGGRYNLLFNKDKNIYGSAFMPFVRAFF